MGFNPVQVVNRLLNISIEETMSAKLVKKGTPKNDIENDIACTKDVDTTIAIIATPVNKVSVPLLISVCADDGGLVTISYKQKTTDAAYTKIIGYIPLGGGSFVFNPEGIIRVESESDLKIIYKAKNINTKCSSTIVYSEN